MKHLITLFLLLVYLICFSNEKIDFNQNTINDSILHYSELAHNYYQAGELESSREALIKLQQYGDIRRLKDVILKKRLFFVPNSFDPPIRKEISGFILKPIKAEHAELDYKAVMGSAEHLTGVLGRRDWPGDLTLEEDRHALEGHEWEFHNRIGFVYTIMNSKETEIVGCLYIYPSRLDNFDAEIVMWVTESEYNKGADPILFEEIKHWLKSDWPFEKVIFPGRTINWGDFFTLLDNQDQKYIVE